MGLLRLVGFLTLQVSCVKYSLFYRTLLQKRPVILRSLLIVATPYLCHPNICVTTNSSPTLSLTVSLTLLRTNTDCITNQLQISLPPPTLSPTLSLQTKTNSITNNYRLKPTVFKTPTLLQTNYTVIPTLLHTVHPHTNSITNNYSLTPTLLHTTANYNQL